MNDPILAERLDRTRRLADAPVDGLLLITSPTDIRWCSGFDGSNGWLLVDQHEATLLTDGRYVDQAAQQVDDAVEIVECRTLSSMIDAVVSHSRGRSVHVQGDQVSVTLAQRLEAAIGSSVRIASESLADLRRTKTSSELNIIREAASIADRALAEIRPLIEPGVSEKRIRDELESSMRRLGADGPSYDTIVAAGPVNSAQPHHRPTDREFEAGDSVVIDVGALLDGYHSDMTRTFFVGEVSAEMERWYEVLAEAQAEALSVVAPQTPVKEIDARCRKVLKDAGLEQWFTHGLGHGVGLLIHENPFLNGTSDAVLMPGDVVTIEPGLYRGGFGGMRIEDLVLVTENSSINLTNSPKDPKCPR